jgi:hypothetical protein
MQGLASLLNPIREFVSRQPRPEVDRLMEDIQSRITEFMGSPVGPPNNIFQEPDQLFSASYGVRPVPRPGLPVNNRLPPLGSLLESKSILTDAPQFNYGKEHARMRMMQRDIKSPEEQAYINKVLGTDTSTDNGINSTFTNDMNTLFNIPPAIAGLPSIFR